MYTRHIYERSFVNVVIWVYVIVSYPYIYGFDIHTNTYVCGYEGCDQHWLDLGLQLLIRMMKLKVKYGVTAKLRFND